MKRTNKIYYIVLSLLFIAGLNNPMKAQEFKKNATAGFTFLHIPVTARTAALGEASIALSDANSSGIFRNPALLGFSDKQHSVSVSYAPWLADIKNYGASYSMMTDFGVIGVGATMLDYGSMPRTQLGTGQNVYDVVGTFEANALALSLGYSRKLTDKFSFGVAIKYVQEKIDIYKASNVLFDGGVIYYTGFESLRIAASISNFGVDTKFLNDEFKMPAALRLGMAAEVFGSYDSEYRVTTTIEALHPNDGDERLNVGAELAWRNLLMLRGGYKFFYDEESYSFGLGLNVQQSVPLQIDFAFSDYGRLGTITRFTLQFGM